MLAGTGHRRLRPGLRRKLNRLHKLRRLLNLRLRLRPHRLRRRRTACLPPLRRLRLLRLLPNLRLRATRLRALRPRLLQKRLVPNFLLAIQLPIHLVQPLHHVPHLPFVYAPQATAPGEPGQLVGYQLQRNPLCLRLPLECVRWLPFATPSTHPGRASRDWPRTVPSRR